jgi:thiosulfate/3-mercaptopyruvate sulfurtransferase
MIEHVVGKDSWKSSLYGIQNNNNPPRLFIDVMVQPKSDYSTDKVRMRWMDPEEFHSFMQCNPTILDCQPNVHDHIHHHIVGSVYVNEESVRLSRMGMPHVWMPAEIAQSILRQLGVSNDRPVAIYSSRGADSTGDGMAQMVLAYSLVRYGHNDIAILDGGLERWQDSSMSLTQDMAKGTKGNIDVVVRTEYNITTQALKSALRSKKTLVIDTRLQELYQGESGFPKPGHIPGAVNLPWTQLVMADNPCQLRETSYLRDLLSKLGTNSRNAILYCATGRKSAALFNIMRFLLHKKEVWLYEGSFTEWCAIKENSTTIGPVP